MPTVQIRRNKTEKPGFTAMVKGYPETRCYGVTKGKALAELVMSYPKKLGLKLEIEEKGPGPWRADLEKLPKSKNPLLLPLHEIGFSARAYVSISRANNPAQEGTAKRRLPEDEEKKLTLADAAKLKKSLLRTLHNCGENTINEISLVLAHYGLELQE